MSFARYVVMICDSDQVLIEGKPIATTCGEEIPAESSTEALEKARLKGWGYHQYQRKPIHLCPRHDRLWTGSET